MSQYLLGLDNGGTNIKAVIFDSLGTQVASASGRIEMLTPAVGFTERDMEKLWEVNYGVIKEAIDQSGLDPEKIVGLSLSGHGKGLYLWGKDDKPAYNGIMSTDTRAYMYPQKWKASGVYDRIFEKTCQNILACQPVSLLAWLKDHRPGVIENTKWIFGVKDYIRYRLTGEAAGEITDMSGSNLVNIIEKRHDIELLREFGLEDIYDKLPPLKQSTEVCGYITKEVSEITGLKEGTPVAGGMFDIDASAIAMDITNEDNLCVIAGTWSINEYIAKEPVLNKTISMNSLYCLPGYYLIEDSSPTSASNNEWFIDMFMENEKEKAEAEGKEFYDVLNEKVESVKPDDQNIIFLPYLYGSNYNPQARASFIGLTSHHTKSQIARAVYEGIVFCHKVHIDQLLLNREKTHRVRLAGGVVNSKVWVQIFADVINIPIETIHINELGALGAAMAAAVSVGIYENLEEAAKEMVEVKETIYPNKENVETYQKKYELYKKVSGLLDGVWTEF